MIRSVKGRLQHLVRSQQTKAFQRNYAVRSIGAATRRVVEDYVSKQPDRHPMADARVQSVLEKLITMIASVAAKYDHRISRVGLLADHVHLTLGCVIDQSPEEIALGFLNNCAYAVGMKPIFQFGYYAGTIGEYDRGAV